VNGKQKKAYQMQIVFGITGLAVAIVILLASVAALFMVCRKQRI
jgi:hypothetical protein